MGIMKKWEEGSQWLYDKFGSKLQAKYDEIDSWQTPAWASKIFKKVWDEILDVEFKKKLYDTIMDVCKKYDSKFAKEMLEGILAAIKKYLKIK